VDLIDPSLNHNRCFRNFWIHQSISTIIGAMFPYNHICCCFSVLIIVFYVNYVFFWYNMMLVVSACINPTFIYQLFLLIVHVIHQPCSWTHFNSLDLTFTFPKVKYSYLGSKKYIKDIIAEFCTNTFMISTNFIHISDGWQFIII